MRANFHATPRVGTLEPCKTSPKTLVDRKASIERNNRKKQRSIHDPTIYSAPPVTGKSVRSIEFASGIALMVDKSEHRHPKGYRLNVIQIPLLRGFGSLILCIYVLVYDLFFSQQFSLTRYLTFVFILGSYCLGSWLILRYGYLKTRVDLVLVFLIADVF